MFYDIVIVVVVIVVIVVVIIILVIVNDHQHHNRCRRHHHHHHHHHHRSQPQITIFRVSFAWPSHSACIGVWLQVARPQAASTTSASIATVATVAGELSFACQSLDKKLCEPGRQLFIIIFAISIRR